MMEPEEGSGEAMNILVWVLIGLVAILLLGGILGGRRLSRTWEPSDDIKIFGERSVEVKQWMQVAVSLAILGVALVIVLSGAHSTQDKHWAYGAVGTILGFWLRGK
jgi:hypothetical protein